MLACLKAKIQARRTLHKDLLFLKLSLHHQSEGQDYPLTFEDCVVVYRQILECFLQLF